MEVMAELLIDESVEKGLLALCDSAKLVTPPTIARKPDAAELEAEALERARVQVAARWACELAPDGDELTLMHRAASGFSGPHPDEADILLEVGSLTGPFLTWHRGVILLNLGVVPFDERTEFVRVRLSRGSSGLSWIQRAPSRSPFGEERDRAAFARVLGARGFLIWLAGMLDDNGSDGEGDWTTDRKPDSSKRNGDLSIDPAIPTLEEMLASWARNTNRFMEIDRRVTTYLPAILDQVDHEDPRAAADIRVFSALWQTLRAGLGSPEPLRSRP